MLLINILIFIAAMVVLAYSSEFATKFSARLAKMMHISEFMLSFLIVAMISAFPETAISIISVYKGIPEFGFATLIGSNIADLTLVIGIVALFSLNGLKVKSEVLRKDLLYIFLLLFPLLLGSDGFFSANDGVMLLIGGFFFFVTLSLDRNASKKVSVLQNKKHLLLNIILLIVSILVLIASAHYTVKYAVSVATDLHVPQVLIGLIVVSLGTCLPELIFALKAIRANHDGLAIGDILGTVIIDGTIVLGIISILSPFTLHPVLVYLTGGGMFIAGLMTILFIRTGKIITKNEGIVLILFYVLHLIVQSFIL